jgi:hypothetical protein
VTGKGQAELKFWHTGGGVHPSGSQYSLQPDYIGTRSVLQGGMAILGATRTSIRVIPPGGNNLGQVDGPWFVYIKDVSTSSTDETVTLIVGRALGHTHSAIDNGSGSHDLEPGDPWYLKRFFVDGHEYNVVALCVEPAGRPLNPGEEPFEFKYITIRTPVPKQNFINTEDSQKLEGYYLGTVLGVDTSLISVMPPFNYAHTKAEDIRALPEKATPPTGCTGESEQFVFGNQRFYNPSLYCPPQPLGPKVIGEPRPQPKYEIRIVDEGREPQFFGELKEMYGVTVTPSLKELWHTEQWNTLPDRYTQLRLPAGQKYLLTSNWRSTEMRLHYYANINQSLVNQDQLSAISGGRIPAVNATTTAGSVLGTPIPQTFYRADGSDGWRVKFLYDPADAKDVYVNTWAAPGGVGTIVGTVRLQGRTNYSGVLVSVGAGWPAAATDSLGRFTLTNVPVGTHTVTAFMPGYLRAQTNATVAMGATTTLPEVRLLGGDADSDCGIDLFDLIAVSTLYGGTPPAGSGVDINGNGVIDIFDLVMVGLNLDKTCPGPWAAAPPLASARTTAPAYLRVSPAHTRLDVGQEVTVTVEVEGAEDLYGVDARLYFDSNVLEVVDANPAVEGVQIAKGTFPYAEQTRQVYISKNLADNTQGTAIYAVTAKRPALPVSGAGTLCSIRFRAKAPGWSPIHFTAGTLVNANVASMPLVKSDGSIRVGVENLLYLPVVIRAGAIR